MDPAGDWLAQALAGTPTAATGLDTICAEMLSIMSPVSICMVLVVVLVSILELPIPSVRARVTASALVYLESPSNSPGKKLIPALLAAAVIVAVITVATYVHVALYRNRCTGFVKHYKRYSVFVVLFSMGGAIAVAVLRRLDAPLDAPTALVLLFNASTAGVLSVFASTGPTPTMDPQRYKYRVPVPIVVRQGYQVALAVVFAVWLSRLPELTTWILLVALVVYDLVAVHFSCCSLRKLADSGSSKGVHQLLVYEPRPAVDPAAWSYDAPATYSDSDDETPPASPDSGGNLHDRVAHAMVEKRDLGGSHEGEVWITITEQISNEGGSSQDLATENPEQYDDETVPEAQASTIGEQLGFKLGLGDFIFYGVLVGRAAMYDLMTVYACYIAIIAGLGCTLILQLGRPEPLPALPISVMLGVVSYFLKRFLMEPFVVGASTTLVMF